MMLIDGNDNDYNDDDVNDYDGSNDNDVNGQDATVVERSREHGQASGNQEWAATGKVDFDDDGLDDDEDNFLRSRRT